MKTIFGVFRFNWLAITALLGVSWVISLRVYYWLKPSLPRWFRLSVRRWLVRRTRARFANEWPILESAASKPADWSGWPEQRKFAFVLTHDVESQRGLDRVRQLAELEMSLGFRSCFNFVPEGSYRVSADLREWLVASGFEVGVHDQRHDGKLYNSRKSFQEGADRINYYLKEWDAVGFRSGFMFHNLEWIKDLNIEYDASTFDTDPFEPQSDGVKTIFPFWVGSDANGGYVELPYTLVQDSTLFIMLQERSNEVWKRKLEWIGSREGMALINVHPDYIAFDAKRPDEDEYELRHYADFLAWVKERHLPYYWHALPRKVAEYFRKQTTKAMTFMAAGMAADIATCFML
jgi:hypothetical protein